MKILLFAGGSGKRFWPLSTQKMPKQFMPIIRGKSTFQMMIKKLQPLYGWHNIFISTNEKYVPILKKQVPEIPTSNIIAERYRRDLGAGVGFALIKLRKLGVSGPIAILWSDGLIENDKNFNQVLKISEEIISKDITKIVFLGENPTFANREVGWIDTEGTIKLPQLVNNSDQIKFYNFKSFVYRPEETDCAKKFKTKSSFWNTGYFVSTLEFLISIYEKYNKRIYSDLLKIEKDLGTERENDTIDKIYPNIDEIHFDHAVPYHIKKNQALVIGTELGWNDPGTLYALKKYFSPKDDNFCQGLHTIYDSKDSMIINEEPDKNIVAIGLDGIIIINKENLQLVIHKDSIGKIKEVTTEFEKDPKMKKFL